MHIQLAELQAQSLSVMCILAEFSVKLFYKEEHFLLKSDLLHNQKYNQSSLTQVCVS